MRTTSIGTAPSAFTAKAGASYGLLGLPLAFVALPLYVLLPNYYAREFGISLATLGWLLLAARLCDGGIDPLLGRWSDQLFARSVRSVLGAGAVAAVALSLGFAALFFPPVRSGVALLVWAAVALLLTYVAFSVLTITHQSWAARLGGDELQRSGMVAWREGWGVVGVLLASIVPLAFGMTVTAALFGAALMAGWMAWSHAPRPLVMAGDVLTLVALTSPSSSSSSSLWHPFSRPAFRHLLLVFMFNGIATAVPATLVLFFVQDRLQAPAHLQPAFLGSYFFCAAVSIPLWLALVKRIGLAWSWWCGMVLAMGVFSAALPLGAGDSTAFLFICAFSGMALGADLALPSALLAGVIQCSGDSGHADGAYFGWWNFATKLNLALAAGLALPWLSTWGYAPGVRDSVALQALSLTYCLLPCLLKLTAAGLLYALILRKSP